MSLDTAKSVATQLRGWLPKPRIEFTLAGEPTLNKYHVDIIAIFRKYLPKSQLMLTTNGSVIVNKNFKANVEELFAVGLNILVIDTYFPERDRLRKTILDSGVLVQEFGQSGGVIPWRYYGHDLHCVVLMDDLSLIQGKLKHKRLSNHAGKVDYVAAASAGIPIQRVSRPLAKRCVLPFREMIIRYNGDVGICCNDYWRVVCGNIDTANLQDIWCGLVLSSIRHSLFNRNREFKPCRECNYFGGFRQGLIWDPLEK